MMSTSRRSYDPAANWSALHFLLLCTDVVRWDGASVETIHRSKEIGSFFLNLEYAHKLFINLGDVKLICTP